MKISKNNISVFDADAVNCSIIVIETEKVALKNRVLVFCCNTFFIDKNSNISELISHCKVIWIFFIKIFRN